MATYLEIHNLYDDGNVRARVRVACAVTAVRLLNEGASQDDPRMLQAEELLNNTQGSFERVLWLVITNPTIADAKGGSTDEDIQTVVDSIIDIMAKRYVKGV